MQSDEFFLSWLESLEAGSTDLLIDIRCCHGLHSYRPDAAMFSHEDDISSDSLHREMAFSEVSTSFCHL